MELNSISPDIIREIGLKLSWEDAVSYFNISKKFFKIGKSGFWARKCIYDFGTQHKIDSYIAPFPGYLGTRNKYLKEKLTHSAAPYQINTFNREYSEMCWTKSTIKIICPNGKEIKIYPSTNVLKKLVEIIDDYYSKRGYPYNSNIAYCDNFLWYDYIKVYELKQLDETDRANIITYKKIDTEIEKISSLLAKYLRDKYPSEFKDFVSVKSIFL